MFPENTLTKRHSYSLRETCRQMSSSTRRVSKSCWVGTAVQHSASVCRPVKKVRIDSI